MCGIPGAWIDVDVHGPAHTETALPPTSADALHLLKDFPLPPSLVVDSGHGLYAFWLFKEVWTFAGVEERAQAASLLQRVQTVIRQQACRRGWKIESTADLARLLRPVGAINSKSHLPPVPVRLLRHGDERFTIEEFEDILPDDDAPIGIGLPTDEGSR